MDTNGSNETVVKMNSTTENKDAEVKSSEPSKKNSKGDKLRKKDDKSVEQVLKALNSLETTEEKLAAMCKKYTDIVDENRKLQLGAKQCEKKCCILQREKEQLQTEHSKAVLSRSRLESLCRELQRQNKAIKEESLLKVREEEEKRKEVSAKFQGTLNEITALMQQNIEKNAKLKEENVEMAQRFGKLLEQYEIREQQVEKLLEQIHIETELGEAKMAKARMEMANERESMLRDKKQLLMDLDECRGKIRVLQEGEIGLREQIRLYTDKYDEFQTALIRSSEVFNGYKGEVEKMSKKISKLEKETTSWKQRWERSHQALLEMAADKQQRDGELALANRRLSQMQALCRTLQGERSALLAQLKGKSEDVKEGKEDDDSCKIDVDTEDAAALTMEARESNIITKNEGRGANLGVTSGDLKEESALSNPYEIDKAMVASPVADERQEVEKISSLVESAPQLLDEHISKAVSDEPIVCATEVITPGSVSEVKDANNYMREILKDEAEKENIQFVGNDHSLSKISLKNELNESTEVSEESDIHSSKKESSVSELLQLNSSNCEEIGNTDIRAHTDAMIKEVDHIEQKLESCSLNDSQLPEDGLYSKKSICDMSDGQPECEKKQLEIISDSSVGMQNIENQKQLEDVCDSVEESEVDKDHPENLCIASAESQMKEGNKQLEDACSTSVQAKEVNNQLEIVGDLSANMVTDKEKDVGDQITAYLELENNCDSKQSLEISTDESKAEPDKEMKEKLVEKEPMGNCSSKKSEPAPINMKKGKESSRKRKR